MAYQKGRGITDLFGTLNRAFKPVVESVADVGANVATGLVGDLLSGKNPKASIKERGNQAKTMAAQRALEKLQGGRGTAKRSRSKSQPPAKRSKQTGGIYPPIHYPLGNYPGYDRVMKGGGFLDFSGLYKKFDKERIADCKEWLKRKQKGSGKKRKAKNQKGAGKKRKAKKQKGSGKQTGAGKKRSGKKRKSRKQTGDGLWSGIKEIFQ